MIYGLAVVLIVLAFVLANIDDEEYWNGLQRNDEKTSRWIW